MSIFSRHCDKLIIFLLENRPWHFMQIISKLSWHGLSSVDWAVKLQTNKPRLNMMTLRNEEREEIMKTFTTLWVLYSANSVTNWSYFPENRLWNFMQIISKEDNLHEMSKPIFWKKKKEKKKKEKCFKMSFCEIFTQSALKCVEE